MNKNADIHVVIHVMAELNVSGEINPNKDYVSNNKFGLQKNDFADNSSLQKIFDFFDANKDGTWDVNEEQNFLDKLNNANKNDGHENVFTGHKIFLESAKDNLNSKSLFDIGVKEQDLTDFLSAYRFEYDKPQTNKFPLNQVTAIEFLNNKNNEAQETLEQRDDDAGLISGIVNFWHTNISGFEKSEKSVQNAIISAKNDVINLEKCYGTDGRFENKFKELRGVEFDKNAISECKQKADNYVQLKSLYELINYLKQEFINFGKCNSRAELGKKLVQAFEICGIKDIDNINQALEKIFDANKQKFDNVSGGNATKFFIAKNNNGEPVLYRKTSTGPTDATNDQIRLFTDELTKMMEKQFLNHCGISTQENLSKEELSLKTQEVLNKNKSEYEKSFKKAYGDKDVSILAEQYVLNEQQSVENINTVLNIISMATMFIPGGILVKGANTAVKSLKAANAGQKVVKAVNIVGKSAEAFASFQEIASLPAMAQLTLEPTKLIELVTSGNATGEDWLEYLKKVGENATFMLAGAGASKIAQEASSAFRMKAVMKVFKGAGKSNLKNVDDILKNLPESVTKDKELVTAFKKIEKQAIALQIPLEVALDLASSYYLTEQYYGEGLKTQDWLMSVGYALAGGTLQKEFLPLSTEAKINKLKKHFKDGMAIELTDEQARKILQTMDEVTAGKVESNISTSAHYKTKKEYKRALAELKQKLQADEDIPKNWLSNILSTINEQNLPLAEKLWTDKDFPKYRIWDILYTNGENIDAKLNIYNKLSTDKDFPKDKIPEIIMYTNEQNLPLAEKLWADKDFPKEWIVDILCHTTEQNIDAKLNIYNKLSADKDLPKDKIPRILDSTDEQNISLAEKLCADKDLPKGDIADILWHTSKQNIDAKLNIYNKLSADKDFPKGEIPFILLRTNEQNLPLAEKLSADKDFPKGEIPFILTYTNEQNIDAKLNIYNKLCADKDFLKENIAKVLCNTTEQNIDAKLNIYNKLSADKDFPKGDIADILWRTNKQNYSLAEKLSADKDFPKGDIADILWRTNEQNLPFAEKLCEDKDFPKGDIADILWRTNEQNLPLAEKLCEDKNCPKNYIPIFLKSNYKLNIEKLIPILKENPDFINNCSDIELALVNSYADFYGKNIYELTKTEKRNLLKTLLNNKNELWHNNKIYMDILKKIPLIPTNKEEYKYIVKNISRSLNISLEALPDEIIVEFNTTLNTLDDYLKTANLEGLNDINLTITHKEFISQIQDILKDLPNSEQGKIQDLFGFRIIDGKLTGYPNNSENIDLSSITDPISIKVIKSVKETISQYTNNNFITVKDTPELSAQLNELSKIMPEILNQIDGSKDFVHTIKILQRIVQNPKYNELCESDKKVLTVATLLHNTDKTLANTEESAIDAYFIAKKFNLSDTEAQKVYSIIENSDLINKFMATNKKVTVRNYRSRSICGSEREDIFDLIAFKLKEGNLFELTQMLYSANEVDGYTRYFDKLLMHRINELKSTNFILPQTPRNKYHILAKDTTITKYNNKYQVKVVNSDEIENFYAIIHTPEAGFATGGTRDVNFANFEVFRVLNDDKVICSSYISNGAAGLVKGHSNGFIFDVANDKQYVGYGTDIFSLGKNIPDLVVEYYRDKGIKANRNRGDKYDHRIMISSSLKTLLYKIDYNKLFKSVTDKVTNINNKYNNEIKKLSKARKQIFIERFGTEKITDEQYASVRNDTKLVKIEDQIRQLQQQKSIKIEQVKGYSKLKEIDAKYAERLEKIKYQLGNETMSIEKLEEIDPKFAAAYKKFLSRNNKNYNGEEKLLNTSQHNEILISNPEIIAIFTANIENLPEEYLIKAQEENLPIVIINTI